MKTAWRYETSLVRLFVACASGNSTLIENAMDDTRMLLRECRCDQCGQLFIDRACGPTHAVMKHYLREPAKKDPSTDQHTPDGQ